MPKLSKTSKNLFFLFSFLLLSLAILLKLYPEIVLRIPHYGFIIWNILGNDLPPFLDQNTFMECKAVTDCKWLKKNDVVIAVAAKSGTNWMMTLVHELQTFDKPHLREFEDILDVTPWAELKHFPGQTFEERLEYWDKYNPLWNNPALPFRAFKSHLASDKLPVLSRPDVKYLAMARNPKDAVFSLVKFIPTHTKEIREMWGGFPPEHMSVNETFEILKDGIFGYFKKWYEVKDLPNVLFLHYSDVFKDPRKYIRIIADFLEVKNLNASDLDIIEERTSISFMKKRGHKYKYRTGYKNDIFAVSDSAIVREGGVNKFAFKEEEERAIEDFARSIFNEEMFHLAFYGFNEN